MLEDDLILTYMAHIMENPKFLTVFFLMYHVNIVKTHHILPRLYTTCRKLSTKKQNLSPLCHPHLAFVPLAHAEVMKNVVPADKVVTEEEDMGIIMNYCGLLEKMENDLDLI